MSDRKPKAPMTDEELTRIVRAMDNTLKLMAVSLNAILEELQKK